MKKYKYTGSLEVHIAGVGIVKPGAEVETQIEINHPDFKEIKKKEDK